SEAPQKVCQLHTIVQTTVLQGHTFLATDFTPPDEVREEILLDRLPDSIEEKDAEYAPLDSSECVPTQPDPRGGMPLTPIGDAVR
ncbi:MAG: hypothetical protein OWT28_02635, partial [Firmicutes bacterium]|nr:hypothetical protein [Bacillota bacterium]